VRSQQRGVNREEMGTRSAVGELFRVESSVSLREHEFLDLVKDDSLVASLLRPGRPHYSLVRIHVRVDQNPVQP
jgi:hypothetical protein